MAFPEQLQQALQAHHRRVEHHLHHLGVAGQARADLFIGGVRGDAAGIAHRGAVHARLAPELALGAPEAAQREADLLLAGETVLQRMAVHEVLVAVQRQRLLAARQRFFRARQALLEGPDAEDALSDSQHDALLRRKAGNVVSI
ncbi:hypothetical protein D3C73_1136340 [compost metagenome]